MFTSDRLSGFGNRLKGLSVLARIRLFRTAEMFGAARRPAVSGGLHWTAA
jgi:hypothetical protein